MSTPISQRQLAKSLGISQSFLSQVLNGKRPMPAELKSRLGVLRSDKQTDKQSPKLTQMATKSAWGAGGQVFKSPHPDHYDAKSVIIRGQSMLITMLEVISRDGGEVSASLSQLPTLVAAFIATRKATKGLTPRGEEWLVDTLGTFFKSHSHNPVEITKQNIVDFLGRYNEKPWRKDSFWRALHTFFNWFSKEFEAHDPMKSVDRPSTPKLVLYTITPDKVSRLIAFANNIRDKAIISLLADSGLRRSEVADLKVKNLDIDNRILTAKVKGGKEGYAVFGEKTEELLRAYIQKHRPADKLFDVNSEGLKTILRRLEDKTGIKCNAHSFRRGFATTLRRAGVSELDIRELGRWESLEMVIRYTKAYTFEDAAKRYKAIVQ